MPAQTPTGGCAFVRAAALTGPPPVAGFGGKRTSRSGQVQWVADAHRLTRDREDTNAARWRSATAPGDNGQMQTAVDHLVVIAASLEDGERWCERTLGLVPDAGGRHSLMGTHNRLLRIDSPGYPDAYLEIIAIEPGATTERRSDQRRWFDLDDPALARRIAHTGPELAHWVARTDDVATACSRWHALGIDRGEALATQRPSPQGLLQWRITVRDDGARLFHGCLPTLIEWGSRHPAQAMPQRGLALAQLRIRHPQSDVLQAAWHAAGINGVPVEAGPPQIEATLITPRGQVVLTSNES